MTERFVPEYGETVPTEDYEGLPDNAAVLVRITPALGYVPGNVAIVCAKIARWMDTLSVEARALAVSRSPMRTSH
jgi:hypothetical protein